MKTFVKNSHKFYSNKNLFDIVEQRVRSANDGCSVFVPHVCNNIDLFGAGFAAQVADKYPSVKTNYHLLGKNFLSKNMGYSQILKTYEDNIYKHKLYFVNMIAQNGTKNSKNIRPLNYLALAKAMLSLSTFIQSFIKENNKAEKVEIHCPKFGSGLAGGNWDFISCLIDDIWPNYDVYIYNPPKNI